MAKSSNGTFSRDLYIKGSPRGDLLLFRDLIYFDMCNFLIELFPDAAKAIRYEDFGFSYWGDGGAFQIGIYRGHMSIMHTTGMPAHMVVMAAYTHLQGYFDLIPALKEMGEIYASHIIDNEDL